MPAREGGECKESERYYEERETRNARGRGRLSGQERDQGDSKAQAQEVEARQESVCCSFLQTCITKKC